MNEVLVLACVLVYFYLAPWWIVRTHMRHLPPKRLARCWNSASFGSAVLLCGPLCLPIHFVKAYGWLLGFPLGVMLTVPVALLPDLVIWLLSLVWG